MLNGSGYRLAAVAQDPKDGIAMWTYTDQPGVQLYTGNFLVGDLTGTSGHIYRQTDAFTLETQHYPDSPQPHRPDRMAVGGAECRQHVRDDDVVQFSTVGRGHYAHDTQLPVADLALRG